MILLDGCRIDALREVAPEYGFINEVEAMTSLGSTSREWVFQTFRTEHRKQIQQTAYVSGNAAMKAIFEEGYQGLHNEYRPCGDWDIITAHDFGLIDNVWEYAPEHKFGGAPTADCITDRAIAVGREHDGKLIAHYMQPHSPYFGNAFERGEMYDWEHYPFKALRAGEIDQETAWNAYLDNLRYVLDSVETLLNNLNADRVAISADHGELFGEFFSLGHVGGIPHPNLKRVPWAVTSASDEETYQPEIEPQGVERGHKDILNDLGYL